MSVRTVAAKFQELVSQGKHFEFMRALYAPEMVSVEGDGRETVGKEQVIHKSEVFQNGVNFHSQDLRGPFFLGDANADAGQFAVYFGLEYSPKAGGDRRRHARRVLLRRGVHLIEMHRLVDGPCRKGGASWERGAV